ncbi:hypothetical protein FDENT_462 [Fusarium denticulatum]|uniref:Zn(2)-C6 fungal-type domain-containing protein n=1 Tax=Fusarium denticulatum TaxID=48507 RepID=A0A8H5XKF5_9HYPO|nr:hypothetical protein FDENT_462 [Fusarium denticulatum]
MSAPRSRQYRRVAQACDNCRRKKIRCPGERPRCSACTRLRQQCSFTEPSPINDDTTTRLENRMSSRLEQLEDKLDNQISRVVPPSIQETTPTSSSDRNNRIPSFSSTSPHTTLPLISSLPTEVTTRAIDFYFRHIHRQPLWLFGERPLLPSDTSEELIYAMLALSMTYNAEDMPMDNLQSPDSYNKIARRGVMLKIAEGRVTIRCAQALCLLAYYNFILGNIPMAGFDIATVQNMIQLLPGSERNLSSSAVSQDISRLFWSIQCLSSSCGKPVLLPSIPTSIDAPQMLTVETRDSLGSCIPAPKATHSGLRETLVDVWSQSLKICELWSDVRLYVAKCFEGLAKRPWLPDSDYTRLCSRMLEIEMIWPISISYNAAKFPEIPPLEVESNRMDWLPWLRVQMTYHTIHCVLNHPSLYTVMAETPNSRLGGDSFWRASYLKALRHCTWVSRLIRTAGEKNLRLADPFFAQAAAIASTLHLYWTRTNDSQLQASSVRNLEEHTLDQFIESTDRSTQMATDKSSPAVVRTSLIWVLLDVAASQFPNYHDQSVHGRDVWGGHAATQDEDGLPRSETSSPPTDMRESTAQYASPPAWVSERTDTNPQETVENGAITVQHGVSNEHVTTRDLAWGPWENLGPMGENFSMNMDWWDMNQF